MKLTITLRNEKKKLIRIKRVKIKCERTGKLRTTTTERQND